MSTASKLLAEQYQSVLEEIKPAVSEAVFARLNESMRRNQELLESLQRENKLLRELRRLDLLEKYGPSAEALSDEQLLELEPGVSTSEVEAESQRTQLSLPLKSAPARKHPGRQQLSAELPRQEQVVVCSVDQCVCGKCGKETTVIGYETSEQLDVEPARYFVRVTKREKHACRTCEEQGVQCAPLPARIIDKSLASDQVIIDTVVSKYADHLPIYRQSAILQRETGIEPSRATMDGWVMRVGELSTPILAAMGREVLEGDYIQADETPVGNHR